MRYELIPPLYDRQLVPLQSLADLLAIEAAEDNCSVNSGGGVLLSNSSGCWLQYLLRSMGFAPKSWTPVYEDTNACIEWSNNMIGGRERTKHIDIRKHLHHGAQNGLLRVVRVSAARRHLRQGTSCPALGSLRLVDASREVGKPVRDVDPRERSSGGAVLQVESRRPLRGVSGRVPEAKARVRHQLDSRLSESPQS